MTPTRASAARRIALAVLLRADDPKAPGVDALLDERCARQEVSREDAALARMIVFGVLRRRTALEHALARFMRNPVAERPIHFALLCGAYQHLALDRVPAHAIVNETVELVAAQQEGGRFRGMANAVMRRITEMPRSEFAKGHWLVDCSVPEWLAHEAADVLPSGEVEAYFRASNEPAPLCFRTCGGRIGVEELEKELLAAGAMRVERSRFMPECLIVEGLRAEALASFREGRATVEDEGAQIACHLAGPRGGEKRVLDLCASPGGKTAHLADLVAADCEIVATDVSEKKLERMRDTLQRVGLADRVRADLAENVLATDTEGFDLVLVDAPCSGLGTLRRHPEARMRRSPEGVRELATIQDRILDGAAKVVRPGGTLAFSVCTWTRAEGEDRARRFLAGHPEFRQAAAPVGLPFDAAAFASGDSLWRTWTHRHGCDAFTVARFEKLPGQ